MIIASLAPTPAGALSVEIHHARHNPYHVAHENQRRAASKRCKPRSTSVPMPTSTSIKISTSSKTSYASKPTTSSNSSSAGGNSGSGGGKVGIATNIGNDPAIKNFKTAKVTK